MQGHYDAVGGPARKIADLLEKESTQSNEEFDDPHIEKRKKKKKSKVEISDFM